MHTEERLLARWLVAVSMMVGSAGAFAAACSSNDDGAGSSPTASNDAGGDAGSSSADGGEGGEDSAAPQAYLRIAHASPDMPPIDVCLAPHGTNVFQGPLLGQLATAADDGGMDGAAPGLAYAQVSAYLSLGPGQYDVRIVSAGAASCMVDAPLVHPLGASDGGMDDAGLPDAAPDDAGQSDAADDDGSLDATADATMDATTDGGLVTDAAADARAPDAPGAANLPSLAFNTHTTLLIAGDLAPAGSDQGVTLTMLPDDAALAGGAAALRVVNAVPSWPALDFGLGSAAATQWTPLLTDVAFGTASAQTSAGEGAVDSNGYLPIAPLAMQAMSVRPSGGDAGDATAAASNVVIVAGSIATVLAIGGKTGDVAHPPALLLCIDNEPSGGLLSDCSVQTL